MKWRFKLCAFLWLFAPAAWAQIANPITQPGHVWAFDGFVIQPPVGAWASLNKSRMRAVFVQAPRADGGVWVATVHARPHAETFTNAEAFLAYMRAQRGQHIEAKRYEIIRHEERLETDASPMWCTRYTALGVDHASLLEAAWFVEVSGRSCWHPQARLIIDANMSERALAGEGEMEAHPAAQEFFSSLLPRNIDILAKDPEALRAQAEAGNALAALRLGVLYEQGIGVPADRQAAERWYRFAAEAGEADAQYNLGLLYLQPVNGKVDMEQAMRWLARAADQRDAQAQFNLGLLLYKGEHFEPDFSEAYYWFRLAAGNGHERARRILQAPPPPDAAPAQDVTPASPPASAPEIPVEEPSSEAQ